MKSKIATVCIILACSVGLTLGQPGTASKSPCGLIQQALLAYGKIKPGVVRQDVENSFLEEGGPRFRDHGRYFYRGCEYIKLEIDFQPAPDSVNDSVRAVSKLFIDYPTKD
jgi:hypothetical protein